MIPIPGQAKAPTRRRSKSPRAKSGRPKTPRKRSKRKSNATTTHLAKVPVQQQIDTLYKLLRPLSISSTPQLSFTDSKHKHSRTKTPPKSKRSRSKSPFSKAIVASTTTQISSDPITQHDILQRMITLDLVGKDRNIVSQPSQHEQDEKEKDPTLLMKEISMDELNTVYQLQQHGWNVEYKLGRHIHYSADSLTCSKTPLSPVAPFEAQTAPSLTSLTQPGATEAAEPTTPVSHSSHSSQSIQSNQYVGAVGSTVFRQGRPIYIYVPPAPHFFLILPIYILINPVM